MHLKLGRDFAQVRQEGRRLGLGCLIANWRQLPPGTGSRLGVVTAGRIGNAVIRNLLGLTDRTHVRKHYVDVALAGGFIEPTIPDKPTSRLQKYRLTDKGRAWLASQKTKGGPP